MCEGEMLAMARAEKKVLHMFSALLLLRCSFCDTGLEFLRLNRAGWWLVHSEWTTTFTKMHYMSMLSGAVLVKFGMHTYRGNISNY